MVSTGDQDGRHGGDVLTSAYSRKMGTMWREMAVFAIANIFSSGIWNRELQIFVDWSFKDKHIITMY